MPLARITYICHGSVPPRPLSTLPGNIPPMWILQDPQRTTTQRTPSSELTACSAPSLPTRRLQPSTLHKLRIFGYLILHVTWTFSRRPLPPPSSTDPCLGTAPEPRAWTCINRLAQISGPNHLPVIYQSRMPPLTVSSYYRRAEKSPGPCAHTSITSTARKYTCTANLTLGD